MGFLSNAFKSKEQIALETALAPLSGSFTSMSSAEMNKHIDAVVAAYTDKGAEKIAANLGAGEKELIDIARNAKKAQEQLVAAFPQENADFLSAFGNVLAYRTADVSPVTFQAANHVARSLCDAETSSGPKTLMQTRALEILANAYISYGNALGGPNGDGGPAGTSNWSAGIEAAFHAARGYKASGRTADSARVYGLILRESSANAITLKDNAAKEARDAVDAANPAAKGQQFKM